MTDEEKRTITVDVDAETERRLKLAAGNKGVSVEQYCSGAIFKELNGEMPTPKFSVEGLVALSDEVLQGRRSYTDSSDLIREAREERHKNL